MFASRFKSIRKWFENCIVRPASLHQCPRPKAGHFCFCAFDGASSATHKKCPAFAGPLNHLRRGGDCLRRSLKEGRQTNATPALSCLPFFTPSRSGEQVRPASGHKKCPAVGALCLFAGLTIQFSNHFLIDLKRLANIAV